MEQDFRWGGINIRYLLRYLLKNLWIGIAVGIILFLAGSILSERLVSTRYSANVLAYAIQGNNAPLPETLSARQQIAFSAVTVLSSDAFIREIKNITGITNVDVSAETVQGTNLLTITCTSDDPKSAYDFLLGILNHFGYITSYVSGSIGIKMVDYPKIPRYGVTTRGPLPSPFIWGIAGVFLAMFPLCCFYLVRITYKGTGEVFRQFGEDILLIIPFSAPKTEKKIKNPFAGKRNTGKEAVLTEIQKLTFLINQKLKKHKKNIILFTSAGNSEGKHTICEAVVKEFGKNGLDVFYMDGAMMNILSNNSVSDTLITHDQQLGCDTIHAEDEETSYSIESVSALLTKIKKEKDVIVICGTSGEDMAMFSLWAGLSDMTYLVIREDTSDIRKIDSLYKELKYNSSSFEGCILNAFF